MGKLFLDTNATINEASEQKYLPETVTAGAIATGGSIKMDSITFDAPTPAPATAEIDLGLYTDFASLQTDDFGGFDVNINGVPVITSPEVQGTPPANTADVVALLKQAIEALEQGPYTYGTWYNTQAFLDWEINLDDVAQTFSVRSTSNGFENNGPTISLYFRFVSGSTESDVLIGNTFLTNGVGVSNADIKFEIGDGLAEAVAVGGTDFTESSDIPSILSAIQGKINALSDFSPDGATLADADLDTVLDTINISTTAYTTVYSGKDIFLTSVAQKAEATAAITEATYAAQNIQFTHRGSTIGVSVPADSDAAGVATAIQDAFTADAGWPYEYVGGKFVAKQAGDAGNGTLWVDSTDIVFTGTAVTETSAPGTYDIVLSGGATADAIVTSAMAQITGGEDPQQGLTPSFETIRKPRKIYRDVAGDIIVAGFGGFLITKTWPGTTLTQNDFFSLAENVVQVLPDKGIGFTIQLKDMADGSSIYIPFLRIVGTGAKAITDTMTEHIAIRIKRVGLTYVITQMNLSSPFKDASTGWQFTEGENLAVEADNLAYSSGAFIRFTFPEASATAVSIAVLQDNGGTPGGVISSKLILSSENSVLLNMLSTKFNNKTFTAGLMANDDADVKVGYLRIDGDA